MPCPLELYAPDGLSIKLLWYLPLQKGSWLFPVETCQYTHLTRRLWHPTHRSAVIRKVWLLQMQAMAERVPEGKGTDE